MSAVGGDATNDDLSLVRCEVGEDDCLWRTDDGTFVRRLFDGRKSAIGEIPSGYVADDELYSLLVPLAVPVEFVRLDGPDDENVVTLVMELDVDVNKGQLLGRLRQVLETGDTDVKTIEQALEKLHAVEDVDGVDQYVEDLFF